MNEEEKKAPACVPYFAHEGMLEHFNRVNKRMLMALITVCITFILTIIIFVQGYTVREKNWLDKLAVREVVTDEGIHEQPDS